VRLQSCDELFFFFVLCFFRFPHMPGVCMVGGGVERDQGIRKGLLEKVEC
jgi:hypothetical protein